MAEYLTSQFYAVNYSLRQRMDILDVSAPGSLSYLSGPSCPNAGARPGAKPLEEVQVFVRVYVARTRGLSGPLSLNLRGWDQCLSDKKEGTSEACHNVDAPGRCYAW